jgi:hypothetical protein
MPGKTYGGMKGGSGVSLTIVYDKSPALAAHLEPLANTIVTKTVFDLEAFMKNEISQPGHGRMYGGHRASAPGDPPATWLGDLLNGIRGEMVDRLHGFVAVHSEHGDELEYGTIHMKPRPYFHPAIEAVRPAYEQALKHLFSLQGLH